MASTVRSLHEPQGQLLGQRPSRELVWTFQEREMYGIRYAPHAKVKAMTFEYVEVFNNRKWLNSTLGYRLSKGFLEQGLKQQNQ
jgi:hypothetical protein